MKKSRVYLQQISRRERKTEEKNRDNRYAFEWFMRSEDQRYWKMTKNLIKHEKKKITVFTEINTVISMLIVISLLLQWKKSNCNM